MTGHDRPGDHTTGVQGVPSQEALLMRGIRLINTADEEAMTDIEIEEMVAMAGMMVTVDVLVGVHLHQSHDLIHILPDVLHVHDVVCQNLLILWIAEN